jgi:hypothetical protein
MVELAQVSEDGWRVVEVAALIDRGETSGCNVPGSGFPQVGHLQRA